jgi:hypothetical protein
MITARSRVFGIALALLPVLPLQAAPEPGTAAQPAVFAPLDLPEWVLVDDAAAPRTEPWILLIDDPQCPHCMRLHLILAKARDADPELGRAVIARLPFPLPGHDQSAHIIADAFCLEESRAGHPWSANAYLDWLLADEWAAEPGWTTTTIEELSKEDGFFDAHYDAHEVTNSRRREYQTQFARQESACEPAPAGGSGFASCHGDEACDALCEKRGTCRAACQPKPAPGEPPCSECEPIIAPPAAANPVPECQADCDEAFVRARYGQFSKVHSACLLAQGPNSAQAKTAAAYAWAIAHHIPGTPTLYTGHPTIGFREPDEAQDWAGVLADLRRGLADARARLRAAPPR